MNSFTEISLCFRMKAVTIFTTSSILGLLLSYEYVLGFSIVILPKSSISFQIKKTLYEYKALAITKTTFNRRNFEVGCFR